MKCLFVHYKHRNWLNKLTWMVTTFSTVSSWLSILSCTITLCPLQESIKTKISKTIYEDHCLLSSLFISYQRNNSPRANFCLTRKSTYKRTVLQETEFEDKRKALSQETFLHIYKDMTCLTMFLQQKKNLETIAHVLFHKENSSWIMCHE